MRIHQVLAPVTATRRGFLTVKYTAQPSLSNFRKWRLAAWERPPQ